MRLIVAGSRTFDFYRGVGNSVSTESIDMFLKIHNIFPTEVVCGCGGTDEDKAFAEVSQGCFASDRGIDLLGEYWADSNHIPIKHIPAKWKLTGRSAGPIRNERMAKYGDALLLIWDGASKGSANMKMNMEKLNKPVYEIIIKKT